MGCDYNEALGIGFDLMTGMSERQRELIQNLKMMVGPSVSLLRIHECFRECKASLFSSSYLVTGSLINFHFICQARKQATS